MGEKCPDMQLARDSPCSWGSPSPWCTEFAFSQSLAISTIHDSVDLACKKKKTTCTI